MEANGSKTTSTSRTAPVVETSIRNGNGNGHSRSESAPATDSAVAVLRPTRPPSTRMANPKRIAVIPAYNEELKINDVVTRTLQYVDEVIVVDDGSTDATANEALDAGAHVLFNIVNRGLGPTMRRAYLEALQHGADIVVQLDADGQYDPAEIPKLVEPILENKADMVLGSRLSNLHYDMPAIKKFGNKAFSSILRRLTGAEVADGQTGFRAIRREVLESGVLPTQKFSYTQEMIIRSAKEGWRVKSVETNFYARYDGKSRLFSSPFKFAVRAWGIIMRTMRDYHPIGFFALPGLILMLLGVAAGGVVLNHLYGTGAVDGKMPTLILSAVLVLAGLQLVFTGLLADMLRRRASGRLQ